MYAYKEIQAQQDFLMVLAQGFGKIDEDIDTINWATAKSYLCMNIEILLNKLTREMLTCPENIAHMKPHILELESLCCEARPLKGSEDFFQNLSLRFKTILEGLKAVFKRLHISAAF